MWVCTGFVRYGYSLQYIEGGQGTPQKACRLGGTVGVELRGRECDAPCLELWMALLEPRGTSLPVEDEGWDNELHVVESPMIALLINV